jgi:hypothetical protein
MVFKQELITVVEDTSILEPSLFGQEFKNSYGSIRWTKVREQFFLGSIVLCDSVDLYREWMKDDEYLILRGTKEGTQERLNGDDIKTDSFVYRFVKASKRGNDVYQYLVKKRLKPLNDLPDVTFFKDNWGEKTTNLLFLTLTDDTKRCDEATAWKNIGKEFHLFCAKLRQEYGDIEYFRTWESTGNFRPHIHIDIAFKDKSFPVFLHTNEDGHRSFRIPTFEKDKISSFWHSHVDVQGVSNTKDAIKELTKYITKDLCSDKGHKTNAMICLFRKQSYAVTKGFVSLVKNSFAKITEENSVGDVGIFDLIKDVMCNCNNEVKNWKFVGVLRGKQLGFSGDLWVVDVGKPPPKVVDLILKEEIRWNALRGAICFNEAKKTFLDTIKDHLVHCDHCGQERAWKDMSEVLGVRICPDCDFHEDYLAFKKQEKGAIKETVTKRVSAKHKQGIQKKVKGDDLT